MSEFEGEFGDFLADLGEGDAGGGIGEEGSSGHASDGFGREAGLTLRPSAFAALRWRSSKLKKVSALRRSAAATCMRSRLRVPRFAL